MLGILRDRACLDAHPGCGRRTFKVRGMATRSVTTSAISDWLRDRKGPDAVSDFNLHQLSCNSRSSWSGLARRAGSDTRWQPQTISCRYSGEYASEHAALA